MPRLICGHLPWQKLEQYRTFIIANKINPELYLNASSLDHMNWHLMADFSKELLYNGISCTIHAPFMDLNPGSVDPLIREATAKRVDLTLQAAALMQAKVVVFHPGYNKLAHGSIQASWLENSIYFWQQRLDVIRDAGCLAAIENIFEDEPSTLCQLLDGINSPLVGHCFDSGHFNMFATVSLEEWFAAIGDKIIESHLHDNFGTADEHLPVGEGNIDFVKVTSLLHHYAPEAIWTLEAHSQPRLERSLAAIQKNI